VRGCCSLWLVVAYHRVKDLVMHMSTASEMYNYLEDCIRERIILTEFLLLFRRCFQVRRASKLYLNTMQTSIKFIES